MAAEALGSAAAFAVTYSLAQNPRWAILLSAVYLTVGVPVASRIISGFKREWELVEGLWSLCKDYERLLLGGPSRIAYCMSRRGHKVELVCLNATYGVLGFFVGRAMQGSSRPAMPLHRDYTCIRTVKGGIRELEGHKIFKGIAVIPSPEDAITAEVVGATTEGVKPGSLEEALRELRGVVSESYAEG